MRAPVVANIFPYDEWPVYQSTSRTQDTDAGQPARRIDCTPLQRRATRAVSASASEGGPLTRGETMLSGCIYMVLVDDARRGLEDIAAGRTQTADTAIAALPARRRGAQGQRQGQRAQAWLSRAIRSPACRHLATK